MSYEQDRDEKEIKRRAAWLLAMLAVVAALLVFVFLTFFNSGDNGKVADNGGPNYPVDTPGGSGSTAAHPGTASRSPGRRSSGASASSTDGPPPKPSCPSQDMCTVRGDIAGAVAAINQFRNQHGEQPVQTTTTDSAQRCALTSGSDCPDSFVWVHVDDLSGDAVVAAVKGYNGTDDLLKSGVSSFALGWAYDPGSKSVSCAVISRS